MRNKKVFLSWVLSLCMVFAAATPVLGADIQFADMPNDWSTAALNNAVDNGLLTGFSENGKNLIKASAPLTRAQMAAIVNKAFNTSATANISDVTDVKSGDWFYQHMAMAVQMNSFAKAEKMRPNDNITREEAFTVLAKVFKLPETSNFAALDRFSDAGNISDYAKSRIAALVDAGYISGSGGKVNPKSNITRAEFAAVMNNIVKQYVNQAGEVTSVAAGNVIVNVPGVTLKNLTVSGDLIIADGVGTGEVTLDSVKVTGKLVVRGGGANSINIIGDSEVSMVIVDNVNNTVRVYTAEGVTVYNMDASGEVVLDGTFGNVVVLGEGSTLEINGEVGALTLDSAADVTISENASVGTLSVGPDAAGSGIAVEGTVTTLTTAAPETVIDVKGSVETINAAATATSPLVTVQETGTVNKVESAASSTVVQGTGKVAEAVISGNNSQVNTNSTSITVSAGTEGVTSGDKSVAAGSTVTSDSDASSKAPMIEAPKVETPAPTETPPPATGGGGGGGGGGGQEPAANTGTFTVTMSTVAGIATQEGLIFTIKEGNLTSSDIRVTMSAIDLDGTVTLTLSDSSSTTIAKLTGPPINETRSMKLGKVIGILSIYQDVTLETGKSMQDIIGKLTEGTYKITFSAGNLDTQIYTLNVVK